ncbi:MAG: ATP-binding cassette domain-containing protein, partial [Propionibacteriaceae bacterium]|nr:ATP-binding cassette domain-containing protein [Propionibacteriaceae bacterium]
MIAADNLCFAYGDQLVLDRLTFVLPDGGRLLLRGPNGSGKTTLLRLVMGLIEPNSGRLTGIDRPIAAVFQDDRLAGQLTAIANLRLVAPRSMPRRRAEDELAAIGLDRGVWSKAVCQLSGGQRRRVAIARAMLQASLADDAIVVLDEPFSGVAQVGQAVDPVAGLDQGAGPASGLGSAADTAPGQDTAGSTAQYAQG